jgi:hypothetical protein
MAAVPAIYCDFLAGVYYLNGVRTSLAAIFPTGAVDGLGMVANNPTGPAMSGPAKATMVLLIGATGLVVIAQYVQPDAGAGQEAVPYFPVAFDIAGSKGLVSTYFGAGAQPNPSYGVTDFFGAGNDVAGPFDYQGLAVFSYAPGPLEIISMNGSANQTNNNEFADAADPGVLVSTGLFPNFRLQKLAMYAYDAIPPSDFPPISGGSAPIPGPVPDTSSSPVPVNVGGGAGPGPGGFYFGPGATVGGLPVPVPNAQCCWTCCPMEGAGS